MTKRTWVFFTLFVCLTWVIVRVHWVTAQSDSAWVRVAVATLWSEPGQLREMDQPSAANPVDLRKWLRNMKVADKKWLVGHLETQALYGQKVTILEERGDWVKVAVDGQPTPRHPAGYPGWMPKAQLTGNPTLDSCTGQPFVIVQRPVTWLYSSKAVAAPFMEISFGTRLPFVRQESGWIQVATPDDGDKWLKAEDAAVYSSNAAIPKPQPEELVQTAKLFLNLPYLWAGVSGFGFDCSGFTYAVYKFYGITIPRDASQQALAGTPVEKTDLRPGDLVFFANQNGKGKVHHVAMYIGNGQFIHAPNSERSVEILPVSHPGYASEYAGARRFIP